MQFIVKIAHALADEKRLQILMTLLENEATVSDLVTRLNLPQPRVSSHLALLRNTGLVSVETVGRQRVYRADNKRVQRLLDTLQEISPNLPPRSIQATREIKRNSALRQARTCYNHLAGIAGVQLLDALLEHGWIEPKKTGDKKTTLYYLTPQGESALRERDVAVDRAKKERRRFAYGCLDWTERREHLAGALGTAVLEALINAGFVKRHAKSREVKLQHPLEVWFEAPHKIVPKR